MKNEKCQELENIKYKSMLLNPNSHKDYTTTANINNINNIEDILDKESQLSKLLPWNKLEKCQKISKLNDFVESYCATNNINKQDEGELKKYLKEKAHKRLIFSHHKNLNKGDYLIDDRTKRGADKFEGEHIHFRQPKFQDWQSVLDYLLPVPANKI